MKFKSTKICAAVIAVMISSAALADPAAIYLTADEDNTGDGGIFLRSEGGSPLGSYIWLYDAEDNGASDGGVVIGGASLSVNTAATINSSLSVNGITEATGINNTGGFVQAGSSVLVGATSINATGAETTNIGTAGGATNIGNVNSVNTIVGTTSSTGAFTQTGVTSINTTGAGATTIGNASNTTTIQSGTNIITGAANSVLSTGANTITAATSNNISAATNNLTATTANNIQGPVNNMGTSSVSANAIGNTSGLTTVTATAGNARQALANGSANTSVTAGASGLTARVDTPNVTTTGQVLLSNTGGTTVNANGKILTSAATDYVNPAAPTAAVTLTNGYGNTHGLVVTESQTTISGGTESSSMTLTDRAATFSNAQTGAPITVTGVADGRADFDAVNVRQFAGAIASVAAQANIPSLAAGQDRTFGMGVGNFMGKSALAMGMNIRGNGNAVYKVTLSSGLNDGAKKAVFAAGAAWGF